MPHCKSCSAPLPPYSSLCEYCGVKNDMDLQGIYEYSITQQDGNRTCPHCREPMETISINGLPQFFIERCLKCMGLFFDPGELNQLLDDSVNQVYSIDLKKIWDMNQMSPQRRGDHFYVPCPVCGELMNRVNFGSRSGVVIDQCKHGVWLDSGELRKLLEWRKAGGQLLHEQIMTERARQEKQKESAHLQRKSMVFSSNATPFSRFDRHSDSGELLTVLAKAVWRLFT